MLFWGTLQSKKPLVTSVVCNIQVTPVVKWREFNNTGVVRKSGKSTKLIVLWTRDRDNPRKPRNSKDYCNLNISGSCILTRKVKQYKVSCYLAIVCTFMFGHVTLQKAQRILLIEMISDRVRCVCMNLVWSLTEFVILILLIYVLVIRDNKSDVGFENPFPSPNSYLILKSTSIPKFPVDTRIHFHPQIPTWY